MSFENYTVLSGHTSPETAYVVDDYPYGFRLRCKIRYWLEFRAKHGFRLVSQTTNPKRVGIEVWNKPKAGIYSPLAVMVLRPVNDKGIREVSHVTKSWYAEADEIEQFLEFAGAALPEGAIAYARRVIEGRRKLDAAKTAGQ